MLFHFMCVVNLFRESELLTTTRLSIFLFSFLFCKQNTSDAASTSIIYFFYYTCTAMSAINATTGSLATTRCLYGRRAGGILRTRVFVIKNPLKIY